MITYWVNSGWETPKTKSKEIVNSRLGTLKKPSEESTMISGRDTETTSSPTPSQLGRSFPPHQVEMQKNDSDSVSGIVAAANEEESKSSFSNFDIEAPIPPRGSPGVNPEGTPAPIVSAETLWLRECILKQRAEKIRKATERSLLSSATARSEVDPV